MDWVPAGDNADPERFILDLEDGTETGELSISDVERSIEDYFRRCR